MAQRRPDFDVTELLTNGFWKTSRAKSPGSRPGSSHNSQSFYTSGNCFHDTLRNVRPPPPPTVEDEVISLARESSVESSTPEETPMRGILEQYPIIIDADASEDEVARLQSESKVGCEPGNPERRFVYVPHSDDSTTSNDEASEKQRRLRRRREAERQVKRATRDEDRDIENKAARGSHVKHKKSRQDLPTLETKIPKDIPPQFRRSNSATSTPGREQIPGVSTPRSSTGEYFLSPDTRSVPKMPHRDSFSSVPQSSARHHSRKPSSNSEQRTNNNYSGSRPGTPLSEKRGSGNFNAVPVEKPKPRLEQLRPGRTLSPGLDRLSKERSSRSSLRSSKLTVSGSEDDLADSDSESERRRRNEKKELRRERDVDRNRSSKPQSKRSSMELKDYPRESLQNTASSEPISHERRETFPLSSHDELRHNQGLTSAPNLPDIQRTSTTLDPMSASIPRPKSRQSNGSYQQPRPRAELKTSLPYPISPTIDFPAFPILNVVASFNGNQQDRRNSHATTANENWQPGQFQPPSTNLSRPQGAYRRYSEDIESGAIAPLPPCPRTKYVAGRDDWLTLRKCPSFDICPSCFHSIMAPTEFGDLFVKAPRRPRETEIVCHFGSSPWYRIAWLLILREKRRDLGLFYGLADIAASIQPCLGEREVVRNWYSITDPRTKYPIRQFGVCHSCVKSVETLLPPIKGIFIKADSPGPSSTSRICDLRQNNLRFVQYFDALETTAESADKLESPPDPRILAKLIKDLSAVDECQQDRDIFDHRWYTITQLPELTICEECFEDVVVPELRQKKAIPMMFIQSPQRLAKSTCQLYSSRMRNIFKTAVDRNDYKLLASKARERKSIEASCKADIAELKRSSFGSQTSGKEISRIIEYWRKWE